MTEIQESLQLRLTMAIIGALGGLFFYLLVDYLPDLIDNDRLLLLLAAFASTFFGTLLLLVGQLALTRALQWAVGLAGTAASLLYWASLRFDTVDEFVESPSLFGAWFMLSALALPFIASRETGSEGWLSYSQLFDRAWDMVVRVIAANLFLAVFWIVLFLSDTLLDLVGFTLIGRLMEETWFGFTLSGLVVGLALAVLHELARVVATLRRLVLSLLRLLVPLVSVVVTLFVILVPFRGLDEVFGSWSAAGTLLAMAFGAVTLIAASVDGSDEEAATSRLMVLSAKILSGILPVMVAIAAYAIWLRVDQYGWTPDRLVGALIAAVILSYAVIYAASVAFRGRWRAIIRQGNVFVALGLMGLAVFWLSPILNAQSISTNSQLSRFYNGRVSIEALDLWSLKADWGRAGRVAIARLAEDDNAPDRDRLIERLDRLAAATSRWTFEDDQSLVVTETGRSEQLDAMAEFLPVMPAGTAFPSEMFADLEAYFLRDIKSACARSDGDDKPACVLVVGELRTDREGPEAIIFLNERHESLTVAALMRPENSSKYVRFSWPYNIGPSLIDRPGKEVIAQILRGEYSIEPTLLRGVKIGDSQLVPIQ